jgi:hypothetical protein
MAKYQLQQSEWPTSSQRLLIVRAAIAPEMDTRGALPPGM